MTTTLLAILALTADPVPDVHATIERALPYIETGGVTWIEERDCVSCHRVSFMVWSLDAAREKGFGVDADKLYEWREWSLDKSLSPREEDGELVGLRNLDGLAQLLIARGEDPLESPRDDSYIKFAELIVAGQLEDGSWKPAGQLPFQKRSEAETAQASTMWNAISLASAGTDEASRARRSALEFLTPHAEAQSAEWYAAGMLLAQNVANESAVLSLRKELLVRQNEDGGWGWLNGGDSDALGTGQALYALLRTGFPADSDEAVLAIEWLCETQRDDGSWAVRGTKAKKKDSVEETAVYWGTCWAVIALLETIPDDA